jgi:hypothetical protein
MQLRSFDGRDDRSGPFGVFADGEFLSLAERGFKWGLFRKELADASGIFAFDAVADGDVIAAVANVLAFAGEIGVGDAAPCGF